MAIRLKGATSLVAGVLIGGGIISTYPVLVAYASELVDGGDRRMATSSTRAEGHLSSDNSGIDAERAQHRYLVERHSRLEQKIGEMERIMREFSQRIRHLEDHVDRLEQR